VALQFPEVNPTFCPPPPPTHTQLSVYTYIYIYNIIYQNTQIHSAVDQVLNYENNKNVLDLIFFHFFLFKNEIARTTTNHRRAFSNSIFYIIILLSYVSNIGAFKVRQTVITTFVAMVTIIAI